jgi:hypothetical protein
MVSCTQSCLPNIWAARSRLTAAIATSPHPAHLPRVENASKFDVEHFEPYKDYIMRYTKHTNA